MVFEQGIWTGIFYGKASGNIGTSALEPTGESFLAHLCYFVVPARLTPPSSGNEFRSTVWIGAVPEVLKSGNAGTLRPDFNPRLLSLTLKTGFLQIGQLVDLLRNGLVPEFQFEIGEPDASGESVVTGWNADFSFPIATSS